MMYFVLPVCLSDGAGYSSSPTWREDHHLLIFITDRLRLGKTRSGCFFYKEPCFLCIITNMNSVCLCLNVLSQFNLAIKDIPEVTHEAKKALAGQLPGIGRSMCVEISLKTSEVFVFVHSLYNNSIMINMKQNV